MDVGAALLAVLCPWLLALAGGIRRELDHVRGDVSPVRTELGAELAEVRRDLGERVARTEGALTGPWRARRRTADRPRHHRLLRQAVIRKPRRNADSLTALVVVPSPSAPGTAADIPQGGRHLGVAEVA